MGNVGFGEIFVLFLVLLIAVGPKRLPEIARNLGKAYHTFTSEMQKAQESLRVAVEEEARPPQTAGGGVIDVPDDVAGDQSLAGDRSPPGDAAVRDHEDT